MSVTNRYILDANVFIEAHQRYYAFGICPGFWTGLVRQHRLDMICSIDKVQDELHYKKKIEDDSATLPDHLSKWVSNTMPGDFFRKTKDKEVANVFGEMMQWVQESSQFTDAAKAEFASVADGWIIAFAKVTGRIVVTHESVAQEARKKVPIPNVCDVFQVLYCNTFEMLGELKIRFILGKRGKTKKRKSKHVSKKRAKPRTAARSKNHSTKRRQ